MSSSIINPCFCRRPRRILILSIISSHVLISDSFEPYSQVTFFIISMDCSKASMWDSVSPAFRSGRSDHLLGTQTKRRKTDRNDQKIKAVLLKSEQKNRNKIPPRVSPSQRISTFTLQAVKGTEWSFLPNLISPYLYLTNPLSIPSNQLSYSWTDWLTDQLSLFYPNDTFLTISHPKILFRIKATVEANDSICTSPDSVANLPS